jgi:hypothetical protein
MTKQKIFSISSSKDVINEISQLKNCDFIMSEPIDMANPSDVLDSPLNPDDVVKGIEMIKLMFEASTAIITFCTALIGILKKNKARARISIAEREIIIDANSSIDEIKTVLTS